MSDYSILEALEKARDLLSNPSHWTKKAMARKADGSRIINVDAVHDGVSCCVEGAILRYTTPGLFRWLTEVNLYVCTYGRSLYHWNDHPDMTHEGILGVLDGLIERRKRELGLIP